MVCPMVQKVSSLSPTAVDICIYCQCLDMEAQLPPTAVDICIYCQCLVRHGGTIVLYGSRYLYIHLSPVDMEALWLQCVIVTS